MSQRALIGILLLGSFAASVGIFQNCSSGFQKGQETASSGSSSSDNSSPSNIIRLAGYFRAEGGIESGGVVFNDESAAVGIPSGMTVLNLNALEKSGPTFSFPSKSGMNGFIDGEFPRFVEQGIGSGDFFIVDLSKINSPAYQQVFFRNGIWVYQDGSRSNELEPTNIVETSSWRCFYGYDSATSSAAEINFQKVGIYASQSSMHPADMIATISAPDGFRIDEAGFSWSNSSWLIVRWVSISHGKDDILSLYDMTRPTQPITRLMLPVNAVTSSGSTDGSNSGIGINSSYFVYSVKSKVSVFSFGKPGFFNGYQQLNLDFMPNHIKLGKSGKTFALYDDKNVAFLKLIQ